MERLRRAMLSWGAEGAAGEPYCPPPLPPADWAPLPDTDPVEGNACGPPGPGWDDSRCGLWDPSSPAAAAAAVSSAAACCPVCVPGQDGEVAAAYRLLGLALQRPELWEGDMGPLLRQVPAMDVRQVRGGGDGGAEGGDGGAEGEGRSYAWGGQGAHGCHCYFRQAGKRALHPPVSFRFNIHHIYV